MKAKLFFIGLMIFSFGYGQLKIVEVADLATDVNQTTIEEIGQAINTYSVDVTASSSTDYTFAGGFPGADPAIDINLGDTLIFNVNSPGHPFWVNTVQGTGTSNGVVVTNNGTSSGTIAWVPSAEGTYYYNCQFHSMMTNAITVGPSTINYTWDNGVTNEVSFTPAASGDYIVVATDAFGCTDTETITLTVNPLPTIVAGADQTVCEGNQVTLSGTGASSYTWDNGVMDGVAFSAAVTTTYNVTGVDGNGCSNTDALTIVVEECTGIVEVMNSNLTIYPNPTSDQITIDIKGYNGPVNVAVYDLQGRLLESTTNTIVSLKKHAKGIYVLKVSYGEVTELVRVVRY